MTKFLFSTLFVSLIYTAAFAQANTNGNAMVKGKLVTADSQAAVNALIAIPKLKMLAYVNPDGTFSFSSVPYGNYDIKVSGGYAFLNTDIVTKDKLLRVAVNKQTVDLGDLLVIAVEGATGYKSGQLPTVALEEDAASADDDGIANQNISGVLTASRDPYLSAAAFTFGPLRYQLRGYDRNQLDVYMNGIPMNDVASGMAIWGQWGGLNDVFRNQAVSFGLAASDQAFGGLLGATRIDATAASQRKQVRITYSLANRTYRNRLMLTYSTGLMKNGWAFSFSGSKRWAKEGYIPGTFYDGYSYYLGISKKLGGRSFLHFTTFGVPTDRGKAMPSTQEAMDLAGTSFYNPNWGYQDGEKRNARVNSSFLPTAILNYEYKPNSSTILNIAVACQQGHAGNSALDWYNALDPRPDYYRKLPSFYLYNPAGADSQAAAEVRQSIEDDPGQLQVDWDRIYQTNRTNRDSVNGVAGNRSLYVIGQDRNDIRKISFSAHLQKAIGEHIKLYTGLAYVYQHTESYRKLLDLLGGDYYVNLNQFAERTYVGNTIFNQNDLNDPDRIVRVGDKYSYDYYSDFNNAYWWGQGVFSFNKVDFFLSGKVGFNAFSREGLYKNGLFPDDSYGKSKTESFLNGGIKGGVTYKIDGRNYLYANAAYMAEAPAFDNTFISSRTRNALVDDITTEKIMSAEGGYLLHSPAFTGRLSGFVTDMKDATEIKRFYDDDYRTFVNYVMRGVDTRNLGAEFALQAKISPSFSATLVATWMQAFYTNRPKASIYLDNDTSTRVGSSIDYIKNYYVASGPQSAYTLGLNYRSPKYWYASVNFNYLDRNYTDINPARRTQEAIGLTPPGSQEWNNILEQEKLPGTFTIDLFAGKSIALYKAFKGLHYGTYLYINAGVNNLLNNKKIITGGFEQMRFDTDNLNPERFPNKYFYGYGLNYFVNVSLKF